MKLRIWIMAFLCLFCTLGTAATVFGKDARVPDEGSAARQRLLTLEKTIADLYKQSNDSHKQEVYRLLQSLKHQLNEPQLLQYGTANGWIMMKNDVLAVEKALIEQKAGIVWREPVIRLRLAVDALLQAEHGPWLQYESLMLDDLQSIRRASRSDKAYAPETTAIYVEKLFERMSRMEIAAFMVGDEDQMKQLLKRSELLQSFMAVHQDGWNQEQQRRLMTIVDNIELSVHALFAQAEETITVPAVTVPVGMNTTSFALLIGAIISGILTFTGYRKYKQVPYGVKNWRL